MDYDANCTCMIDELGNIKTLIDFSMRRYWVLSVNHNGRLLTVDCV